MLFTKILNHHKYASPISPKLQSLKDIINSKLNPICFYIKNDPNYSTYIEDEHFYGILCSPLFEGKTQSGINSLYRVRVHGWICFVNSVVALAGWVYFCYDYKMGDSKEYQDLVTALKETTVDSESAEQIANKLAEKMQSAQQKVKDLVKAEFGVDVNEVKASGKTVTVTITGTGSGSDTKEVKVTVKKEKETKSEDTIEIKVEKASSDAQARRIARRLAKALTQVKKVNCSGGGTIDVEVTMDDKIKEYHVLSPLLLFPVGSFAQNFSIPAILPFAFLDLERYILEVAGYVGVANYAIGRADLLLGGLPQALKEKSVTAIPADDAATLVTALNSTDEVGGSTVANIVKQSVAQILRAKWGAEVDDKSGGTGEKDITVSTGSSDKLEVTFTDGVADGGKVRKSKSQVVNTGNGVKLTIKIKTKGSLTEISGDQDNDKVANAILDKLKKAAKAGKDNSDIKQDFNAFAYIAAHDMLAMFCRFFYGKLSVGYN